MQRLTYGFVGQENEIKYKQIKWPGNWNEYNEQDHILNLPLPHQPLPYQLRYYQSKKAKLKLYQKNYMRYYYRNHKPKINEASKLYYQNNKEKYIVYEIKTKQQHPERIKEYQRRHREKNRDKLIEYSRTYYSNNKDKESIRKHNAYIKNKMELKNPKRIRFIEVAGHKLPRDYISIRLDDLTKLQEAMLSLEISPPVILFGSGSLINILFSGLKPTSQLFYFFKEKAVYFCIEHKIKSRLIGRIIK